MIFLRCWEHPTPPATDTPQHASRTHLETQKANESGHTRIPPRKESGHTRKRLSRHTRGQHLNWTHLLDTHVSRTPWITKVTFLNFKQATKLGHNRVPRHIPKKHNKTFISQIGHAWRIQDRFLLDKKTTLARCTARKPTSAENTAPRQR